MAKIQAVKEPKVSIIIPVYNGSDFLAEAIESALSQTHRNIEILVVNDGSSDDGATERVARAYGSRIRYISKSNGGVASALNMGIDQMSGEYFSWLSHDDLYTADKIERELEFLTNVPVEDRAKTIVYSDYAAFTNDPNQAIPVVMPAVEAEDFRYWITIENCLHGCTLLIPSTAFKEIGVFDDRLRTTQDYDLWFRMAKEYRFVHLGGCLVKARSHPRQGTRSMPNTVKAEGNSLLSKFALELTEEELLRSSQQELIVAYARIASSLWYRGYANAGMKVTKHTLGRKASLPGMVKALGFLVSGIVGCYVMKPIRRRVPNVLRTHLRQRLLRPRTSASSTSPAKLRNLNLSDRFSTIYADNIFRGSVSRSGAGSDLVQTAVIRRELPRLLREYGVHTMLDAPCGDWFWMREVDLPVERYIGIDIVNSLIQKNQKNYGGSKNTFLCANLASEPLPASDLIFSRDCLVHLTFSDALKIISNMRRSGAKYLVTTTFVNRKKNEDLGGGFWRVLNMQLPPFNFPEPIQLINENCTEDGGVYADKSLGVWLLQDIKCGSRDLV
jgi:glycosyltransferase involved in cell wall biosynthesis/SAM-dependent methyltransferase